jgi:hypothetical protein
VEDLLLLILLLLVLLLLLLLLSPSLLLSMLSVLSLLFALLLILVVLILCHLESFLRGGSEFVAESDFNLLFEISSDCTDFDRSLTEVVREGATSNTAGGKLLEEPPNNLAKKPLLSLFPSF